MPGPRRFRLPDRHDTVFAHQMEYCPSALQQIIGNDAAVTAPPDGFGTHDRAAAVAGEILQPRKAAGKFVGQGVVGIIVKALIGPESVHVGAIVFDSSAVRQALVSGLADLKGRAFRQGIEIICGLVRDRGTLLCRPPSEPGPLVAVDKSGMDLVEWPIVKMAILFGLPSLISTSEVSAFQARPYSSCSALRFKRGELNPFSESEAGARRLMLMSGFGRSICAVALATRRPGSRF